MVQAPDILERGTPDPLSLGGLGVEGRDALPGAAVNHTKFGQEPILASAFPKGLPTKRTPLINHQGFATQPRPSISSPAAGGKQLRTGDSFHRDRIARSRKPIPERFQTRQSLGCQRFGNESSGHSSGPVTQDRNHLSTAETDQSHTASPYGRSIQDPLCRPAFFTVRTTLRPRVASGNLPDPSLGAGGELRRTRRTYGTRICLQPL